MTHAFYTYQQLHHKSITNLKQIYSEIGCTVEVSDRRCKDSWISAIAQYQASILQKIARPAIDEQAIAQAELDQYIADQAQTIAPELTTVTINSNHYEIYAGKQLIAYITYDHSEFVTQPWLVMVNGEEIFRDTTQARCQRFIQWHHKDGTLNPQAEVPEVPTISEISFYDQEAFVNGELIASIFYDHDNHEDLYWRVLVNDIEIFRDTTPARCHSFVKQQYQQGTLPVQEPFEEPCTTGNEIMAQIFVECEKFGLDFIDDGIYHNKVKLGEVGCTNGNWWFLRTGESQERVICDSALDTVWWLSITDDLPTAEPIDEYLQYRSLEQMSFDELQGLLEHQPQSQGRELVTV